MIGVQRPWAAILIFPVTFSPSKANRSNGHGSLSMRAYLCENVPGHHCLIGWFVDWEFPLIFCTLTSHLWESLSPAPSFLHEKGIFYLFLCLQLCLQLPYLCFILRKISKYVVVFATAGDSCQSCITTRIPYILLQSRKLNWTLSILRWLPDVSN